MTQLPNTDADGETQVENGMIDEKQPLNNGCADKIQILANTDATDDVHVPGTDAQKPSLFQKNNKRKYKTYDNGKRSHINLAPLTARGIHIEKTIKQKTGLTRVGLLLAILCILLTIALIVCFILWPKHSTPDSVCVMPSCLRSSAEILPKLDLNVSPCTDFRNYACGNWFASNPLPKDHSEWNTRELLQSKYRQKVHQLLMTKTVSTISGDSNSLWKMKNFHDSCMSLDDMVDADKWHLKKEIKTFGGWEVLRDFRPAQWNTPKTLEKLYSQFHVSPFFQIDVVPDTTNPKQNIILLKPPTLGLPNINYYLKKLTSPVIVAYMRYIKDITQLLGATDVDAARFSEDLFHFEQRIAELLVPSKENSTQPYNTKMKIRELNAKLHPIQLHTILLSTLPNANLNQETNVSVTNMEYFRKLPSLITMSDQLSLNKYLIWCLVAEYVPYLSDKYLATLHTLRKELSDQYEPIPRWEFCIMTLQKYAGFGLLALFENEIPKEKKEKTESVVSVIYSETFSTIKKHLVHMKHSEVQQGMIEKARSLAIQIGLPSKMLQSAYIDEYYSDFNAIQSDFYQNIVSGGHFIQNIFQRKLKDPRPEDSWLGDMISTPAAITYNAAANYIIVPSSLLQRPYFESDYPLISRYGGVGTEMAKAVISSLIPNNAEEERNKYVSAISECLLEKDFSKLNTTDKALFTITLAGLKYSYQCLKNELSVVEPTRQPAMEAFNNEQLFFIYYVQSTCAVKTDRRRNNEMLFSTQLDDSVLSNKVLTELPEFTQLYSCSQSSKYSSSLCPL